MLCHLHCTLLTNAACRHQEGLYHANACIDLDGGFNGGYRHKQDALRKLGRIAEANEVGCLMGEVLDTHTRQQRVACPTEVPVDSKSEWHMHNMPGWLDSIETEAIRSNLSDLCRVAGTPIKSLSALQKMAEGTVVSIFSSCFAQYILGRLYLAGDGGVQADDTEAMRLQGNTTLSVI